MVKKMGTLSIRMKLMLSIGGIVVFFIIAFLVKDYRMQANQLIKSNYAILQEDYRQVLQLMDDTARVSYSLALWVSRTPAMQRSLALRDRKALMDQALPLFESLKDKLNIAQFQFHIPPATSFLRLHKIKKYGDDLSAFRKTVVEANRRKIAIAGLEKGVAGLGIRGVVPVFYQGRHVGSVEFGSGLTDALILPLKEKYGFSLSILIPQEDGFRCQARTQNWKMPTDFRPLLSNVFSTGKEEVKQIDEGGHHQLIFLGPLRDYEGRIVGAVAIPKDITQSIQNMHKTLLVYVGAGFALVIVLLASIYLLIGRFVANPVNTMKDAFFRAGEGDLTQRVMVKSPDELGELAQSFNEFQEKIELTIRSIAQNSETLDNSAGELNAVAGKMTEGSEKTSGRANNLAIAAREMSTNMTSVAAATEQATANISNVADSASKMNASFSQITQRTEKAQSITQSAVEEACNASARVDELGKAAKEIEKVTETITDISEQTSLLSLNATIEAARAGDAGRGFAVVANEIKELSKQTSAATGEIKNRIDSIQGSTTRTVAQIERIATVINDIDAIVSDIASEINQQSDATSEIADNMAQAALGLSEMTHNVAQSSSVSSEIAEEIEEINHAALDIANSSSQVNRNSEELNRLSGQLRSLIQNFRL